MIAPLAAASGPVNYGVLAQGASVTQPFTFSAVGSCGGSITANLKVQDGALNLGTFQTNYSLGTTATIVTQNFDTMTAPTLPAGSDPGTVPDTTSNSTPGD